MAVSYGKGDKAKATKLHSVLIRKIGFCENCRGNNFLQCAHIISRRYSGTRTDLRNAFCLCASCHRRFTDWPREFSHFITDTWAADIYDEIKVKANNSVKVDWSKRLEFLKWAEREMERGATIQELRIKESEYAD